MKLTEARAMKEIKRMLANPMLAPQSADGMNELIACLMRHCDSAEHAEATMTAFLDGSRDPRNMTAELRACADQARQGPSLPEGCDACGWDDEATGKRCYHGHVLVTRGGVEAMTRCSCARGQALAAVDRRRDSAQADQYRKLMGGAA